MAYFVILNQFKGDYSYTNEVSLTKADVHQRQCIIVVYIISSFQESLLSGYLDMVHMDKTIYLRLQQVISMKMKIGIELIHNLAATRQINLLLLLLHICFTSTVNI